MEKYQANYIKGLYAKKPHPNAPKFIISNISMKRLDLITYLQNSTDEYINAQIKECSKGYYVELDTWKKPKSDTGEVPTEQVPNFNEMVEEVVENKKDAKPTTTRYVDENGDEQEIPF